MADGVGAIPYQGGVTFRVWAPFANRVFVAGSFNGWSHPPDPSAIALQRSDNPSYWSADVPGASPGDQYRFVVENGDLLWRIDPYAKQVTNSTGNAVVFDPAFDWGGVSFNMPPWNELVVYELHTGSFNDPGDPTDSQPGTFDHVIEKLPYLRDLGINAIEVMPIAEFPGDLSWGYDPACLFAVETAFGGPLGFKRLVKAAHEHGIAVILDVVYNHLGPNDIFMWQFDGWQQNDMGGIYFYQDGRAWTPWGDKGRPDYGRPEVRQYVRDSAMMWLDEFQVDGLRMDATAFIRTVHGNENNGEDLPEGWGLMQWINSEVSSRQPWKITIAEDLKGNDWLNKSVGEGGAGFATQWDVGFAEAVRGAIIPSDDGSRGVGAVRDAIHGRLGAGALARVIYTESHDEADKGHGRVPDDISPGDSGSHFARKRSTLGAALALTSPGIPMLLQGQEFVEYGYFNDTDPVHWNLLESFGGIHDLYRDLIRLRRNWYNNTRGLRGEHVNVFHAGEQDKVIAFHRWDQGGPGDDVVIVCNLSNTAYDTYTIGFPNPGLWRVRLNSDWTGYSPDFGNWHSYDTNADWGSTQGMPCYGNVGIGPYTAVILSQ